MTLTCIVNQQFSNTFLISKMRQVFADFHKLDVSIFAFSHFKNEKVRKWQGLKCEKYFAVCFAFQTLSFPHFCISHFRILDQPSFIGLELNQIIFLSGESPITTRYDVFLFVIQDVLKRLRLIDDRVINALNSTLPTESFKQQKNSEEQCREFSDQVCFSLMHLCCIFLCSGVISNFGSCVQCASYKYVYSFLSMQPKSP